MDRTCHLCNKVFPHPYRLKSHLARKNPCVVEAAAIQGFACDGCGKLYTRMSYLNVHRQKFCPNRNPGDRIGVIENQLAALLAAGAPKTNNLVVPQNIQNNVLVMGGIQNNVLTIGGNINPPGWKLKFPMPQPAPSAFPSFTPTIESVIRAATARGPKQMAACVGDGPSAEIAARELIAEVVKHSAKPKDMNIYPVPGRPYHVSVYVPDRWETRTLQSAIVSIEQMVVDQLKSILKFTPSDLAAQGRAALDKIKVLDSSDVSIHVCKTWGLMLENLKDRIKDGRTERIGWLGSVDSAEGSTKFQDLGLESHDHLSILDVAMNVETTLNVDVATDLTEETMSAQASQALKIYAKLVLHGHPENLTLYAETTDAEYVLVRKHGAWVSMKSEQASEIQARELFKFLGYHLNMPEARFLNILAEYIKRNIDRLVAVEVDLRRIFDQYILEAKKYHETHGTKPTEQQPCQQLIE